jgi:hypothetical protein
LAICRPVSWAGVPLYQDFGQTQTFQIRLYPDGRIEFAYNGVSIDAAVVGISPGGLLGATSVVSFATAVSGEYSSTLAERFSRTQELDLASVAQKFYQTHDDSYDYLVIYNNLAIGACSGAVACEFTLRNNRTGYGDTLVEIGAEFGSAKVTPSPATASLVTGLLIAACNRRRAVSTSAAARMKLGCFSP